MFSVFFATVLGALFGYFVGRNSLPTGALLEGAVLVVSAGDYLRSKDEYAFAQRLYTLAKELRKAAGCEQ